MQNEYLTTIAHFPNVLSADECRRLIELPLQATDAAIDVRDRSLAGRTNSRVDYEFRRTRIKPIPPSPEHAWIFQRLGALATQVNQYAFHFHLNALMTIDVLRYDPDGYFDWHLDIGSGIFSTRKLSLVTFLTPPDDYEGGDLRFMDRGAPLKLPQGTTAIFPSYLLHKVDRITRGTRFSLVSWAHGPSFS